MKKLIAILMALTLLVFAVSAKTYSGSDWAEPTNDALELTWSEDPTKNVEKGEFMFSFLRMIQASRFENDLELLESDTKLDFYDEDELSEEEADEARILVDLGVLNGYQGYMNMDGDVTRAEAAKILFYFNSELELEPVRSLSNFGDISGHWAEAQINYAYRLGMVNGKGLDANGLAVYDPEGNLTIEEMVQIMYNISKVNRDFSREAIATALVDTFEVETDLDVIDYEYGIDDDESIIYLNVDDTLTYTADSGSSYWTSSKPSVVAVTSRGKITARSEGKAIVSNGNDVVLTVIVGETSRYLTVGDEIELTATTSGSWTSSNKRVATVDRYGVVTGVKAGTVTISKGDTDFSIEVVDETVIEMELDESIKLGNSSANWESSDEDVVEVSSKGTITAVGTGTATVSSKYATYMVVVAPTSTINMNVDDTIKLNGSGWISSRTSIVSVSGNTIKAIKNGTATITNGNNTIVINVGYYNSGYTRCYTLYVGETKTLGNGKYDSSWDTDDSRIVNVTSYGKVTARRVGEAVVYNDDNEYLITVIDEDDDEDYEYTLNIGDSILLGDGYEDSSWRSSNTKVATVSDYGIVTAKAAGEATIYNDYDEYYITVVDDEDNSGSGNTGNDDDYEYSDTIIYAEGFEPSTYYNAWTGDTIKIIVESENGDLEDVTLSNSKCKLTKDITSLGSDKYTFTVNSVSAGACILTLEFEDGETIEFTINSYKE